MPTIRLTSPTPRAIAQTRDRFDRHDVRLFLYAYGAGLVFFLTLFS